MKAFLAVATIALMVATSRAGQFLSAYNLVATPQLVIPQAYSGLHNAVPGIIPAANQPNDLAHPAVVENAIAESQYPQNLLNPFYKNPTIAAGLAKESWFGDKEFPVHHREAEKISREKIYDIIRRLHRRR